MGLFTEYCPPPALVLIMVPWWPLSCLRCCVMAVMVREVKIKGVSVSGGEKMVGTIENEHLRIMFKVWTVWLMGNGCDMTVDGKQ